MEGASVRLVCFTVLVDPLMRTGPISKYLPDQRHLVQHRVIDGDAQIVAVLPFQRVATLHAPAFFHCVDQGAQQHFVVIGEPARGAFSQQALHHHRRQVEFVGVDPWPVDAFSATARRTCWYTSVISSGAARSLSICPFHLRSMATAGVQARIVRVASFVCAATTCPARKWLNAE